MTTWRKLSSLETPQWEKLILCYAMLIKTMPCLILLLLGLILNQKHLSSQETRHTVVKKLNYNYGIQQDSSALEL